MVHSFIFGGRPMLIPDCERCLLPAEARIGRLQSQAKPITAPDKASEGQRLDQKSAQKNDGLSRRSAHWP
jgi:hypothetical protein